MAHPFESSIQLTDAACQLIFASETSYIEESSSGQIDIYANSVNVMTLTSSGMALVTGAFVDTIETTLTDDDTHIPTSGAVFAAISSGSPWTKSGTDLSPTTAGDDILLAVTDERIVFGDGDTFIYEVSDDVLVLSAGSVSMQLSGTIIITDNHRPSTASSTTGSGNFGTDAYPYLSMKVSYVTAGTQGANVLRGRHLGLYGGNAGWNATTEDAYGGYVWIIGGAGEGIGDGGGVYIEPGPANGTGADGQIYFGGSDEVSPALQARGSETNVVYYNTTTGLLTYGDGTGLAGGGGEWTADTNGINYTAGNVGIGVASHSSYDLRVAGSVLLDTKLIIGGGSDNLQLYAGVTADHVYMEFFADSAAQTTRSAYFGFSAAGVEHIYLKNEFTAGNININPGSTSGAVQLQYGGSVKLATGSGGVSVTGGLTATGEVAADTYFRSTDNAVVLGTNSAGTVYLRPTNSGSSVDESTFTTTLATINTPLRVTGKVTAENGIRINSTSTPITYFETGTTNYARLVFDSGSIRWDFCDDGDGGFTPYTTPISMNPAGAVELRHNGTVRLQTTSTGINTIGISNANTHYSDAVTGSTWDNNNAAAITLYAPTTTWAYNVLRVDTDNGFKLQTLGGALATSTQRWYTSGSNYITFSGTTITASLSGTATNATNVYVYSDDTGDTNLPIVCTANTTAGYKPLYEDSLVYVNNTTNVVYAADFIASSDRRLKHTINPAENVLARIMMTKGLLSTYITNVDEKNKIQLGYIAQDLLPMFPELVYGSEEEMYNIAYLKTGAIAMEGVALVKTEVDQLRERIVELESQVHNLKHRKNGNSNN